MRTLAIAAAVVVGAFLGAVAGAFVGVLAPNTLLAPGVGPMLGLFVGAVGLPLLVAALIPSRRRDLDRVQRLLR